MSKPGTITEEQLYDLRAADIPMSRTPSYAWIGLGGSAAREIEHLRWETTGLQQALVERDAEIVRLRTRQATLVNAVRWAMKALGPKPIGYMATLAYEHCEDALSAEERGR